MKCTVRAPYPYECTYSLHCTCTDCLWVLLQGTLHVHGAVYDAYALYTEHQLHWLVQFYRTVHLRSALADHTAHALCTCQFTDSVHCRCMLHGWVRWKSTLHVQCVTVSTVTVYTVSALTIYTAGALCTCRCTDSAYYMCTVYLWEHWKCALHLHCAPMSTIKLYTARTQCTGVYTDIIHCRCSGLDAHEVCKCSELYSTLTHMKMHIAMVENLVNSWSAPHVQNVRQRCMDLRRNCYHPQYLRTRRGWFRKKLNCIGW